MPQLGSDLAVPHPAALVPCEEASIYEAVSWCNKHVCTKHWVQLSHSCMSPATCHLPAGPPASGPPVVKSLHKAVPDAFLDCHLCTVHPENYVADLAAAGELGDS